MVYPRQYDFYSDYKYNISDSASIPMESYHIVYCKFCGAENKVMLSYTDYNIDKDS